MAHRELIWGSLRSHSVVPLPPYPSFLSLPCPHFPFCTLALVLSFHDAHCDTINPPHFLSTPLPFAMQPPDFPCLAILPSCLSPPIPLPFASFLTMALAAWRGKGDDNGDHNHLSKYVVLVCVCVSVCVCVCVGMCVCARTCMPACVLALLVVGDWFLS